MARSQHRRPSRSSARYNDNDIELAQTRSRSREVKVNQNGHRVDKHIEPLGESGRRGFNPWKFVKISFRSACTASALVNVLWPVVPAAIAVRYARHDLTLAVFILNYIAMVPCANLVGFAGQEFSRKLPRVAGILIENFAR